MTKPLLVGVAGGSGSGKTLVVRNLVDLMGADRVTIVEQDAYYVDLSHLTLSQRASQNFDHPDAFDDALLLKHLRRLARGEPVSLPVYDFTAHLRKSETLIAEPREIVIVEGILVLQNPGIRELLDFKVFVDTAPDIRLIRRLRRDLVERGRNIASVLDQYEQSVRPMHLQYVEPSKDQADLIIPQGGENRAAIDRLKDELSTLLKQKPPASATS